MSHRVLLVDALNLVRRVFEARGGAGDEEFVASCSQSLQRTMTELAPTHGVVVWDSSEPTWRHLLDDRYKANRDPTPPVLVNLIPGLIQRFESIGISSLTIENYEADDVIATLAAGVASNHGEAVILSTDKMFYPLLIQGVRIYHQFERRFVDVDEVQAKFGLNIDQLVDYWALSGDNSNNIKGLPGVGKKTAIDLLNRHGDIQTMLQRNDIKKLANAADEVRRCQQLVALKQDVALGINLKDFRLN